MRRGTTPCIIDKQFNAQKLTRLDFADRTIGEDFLQEALDKNPELLPIEEIDSSYGPLVSLGREIDHIDNLFISPTGKLTLVETKLWRNPEAVREVLAQVLNYAARLSRWAYQDLEQGVKEGLSPTPLDKLKSLYKLVASKYPKEVLPEIQFCDEVTKTLKNVRILLLVVGDGIREGVEDLLEAVHRHPKWLFTFGLVEMQVYENPCDPKTKIVVPQVISNTVEVVRGVVKVHTTGEAKVEVELEDADATKQAGRRTLSETEFFNDIADEKTRNVYRKLMVFAEEIGAECGWRTTSVSVQYPDPQGSKKKVTLFVMNTSSEIYLGWSLQQVEALGLPTKLSTEYVKQVATLFANVQQDPKYPDALTRELTPAEVDAQYERFTGAVRSFVEKLGQAAK